MIEYAHNTIRRGLDKRSGKFRIGINLSKYQSSSQTSCFLHSVIYRTLFILKQPIGEAYILAGKHHRWFIDVKIQRADKDVQFEADDVYLQIFIYDKNIQYNL